ncbi:CCR4-Not complex component, Not N-terminal domain-containing protein [Auriculariales sp. MPI-PUGE-AT-0066]|nr:CCR4-Not complex component, Not N-terminal domain-containing protein [Auriculariales sp. MPI-PUGE-AT-0066]
MSARIPLQEIERTLRAVSHRVAEFDDTFNKLFEVTSRAQRESTVFSLKTQISRLHCLRDQIKSWILSRACSDEQRMQLMDMRRLIETCMERFKARERGTSKYKVQLSIPNKYIRQVDDLFDCTSG